MIAGVVVAAPAASLPCYSSFQQAPSARLSYCKR